MSNEKSISNAVMRRIYKLPCNGVARYKLKESPGKQCTYSEAYEAIFWGTGGHMGADGKRSRVFTHEGILRIRNLNRLYLSTTEEFVTMTLQTENEKIVTALQAVERLKASAKADIAEALAPVAEPQPSDSHV